MESQEHEQIPVEQPSGAIKVRKGFQIAGFILSIWSVFFFLVPFINLVPATLGLIFSLVSIRRKNLHGLSVTGLVLSSVALVGTLIVSISFSGYLAKPNDREPCKLYMSEIEQLNVMVEYMEIDLTAQNMTGNYDLDSVNRQLRVVEAQLVTLTGIDGSEEFDSLRDSTVDAMQRFVTYSRAQINGMGTSLTEENVNSKTESTLIAIATYCEDQ